ncbi:MAG: metallophosphoesterase [Candidatus Polarisedimenticolia bacterium]
MAVVAPGVVPVPSPVAVCTLGGALQEALDVPPEAVALALDEETRAERRRRAAEIAARLDADAADGRLALAPFAEPVAPGGLVLRGGEALRNREIWAIGDIHGDLLALECCAAAIERAAGDRPHVVLLLGDLIDDGALSYDTMLRAMELLGDAPDRYALLAGNHDVALSYDEATGTFASDVEPGDLADDLDRMGEDEAVVAAGRAYVRLIARAPRALFLPDGTLAAHGGVPQRDLWDGLATPRDLDDALCRNDFVWCRASERARRRLPSRAMRGAEFGCEDFAEFCALASGRLGIPLGRMLRGHDHFEGRFCLYERYRTNPIVGVNALSRRLDRELFGAFARRPVVARWRAGEAIDVFPVAVPDAAVERLFGGAKDSAGAAADDGGAAAAATNASDAAASDISATAVSDDDAAFASDVAVERERGE